MLGDLMKLVNSAGDMASLHMGVTMKLLLYRESDMKLEISRVVVVERLFLRSCCCCCLYLWLCLLAL